MIVARAVAFADEHGTDTLSMRKLTAELGYEVMSLYNHVANKAEVLSPMVDAVAAEIPPSDPAVDPNVDVRTLAVDTRAALVRHRWAAGLWLRQMPGPPASPTWSRPSGARRQRHDAVGRQPRLSRRQLPRDRLHPAGECNGLRMGALVPDDLARWAHEGWNQ